MPSAMIEGKRQIDLAGDDDEGQRQGDDAELRRRLGEGAVDVEIGEDGRRGDDEGEPHREPDADDAELAAVAAQSRRRRDAVVGGTVRNRAVAIGVSPSIPSGRRDRAGQSARPS